MSTANRVLDDAVQSAHQRDQYRADRLLEQIGGYSLRRAEARRIVIGWFEILREEGASWPGLADELKRRRELAREART